MARPPRDPASNPKQAAISALARAQADLERAVEELDRLPAIDAHSVALAAHALNNFLTVSRGVIDLLIPALAGHTDTQVAILLEGLSHSTDLMTHTVGQLMNNAAAPSVLRTDDVNLPNLVERACAYYRRAANHKQIDLAFTATADVPIIRTDRVLVAAILDNLLSNAVKYSPHERHIWVEVRAARGGATCSVRDEGPGLSNEEQARLFTPGVRLGAMPSGGEPSTGYGLALAKRFAGHLGGELTCTSAPNQGATFSLWLPPVRPGA